MSAGSKLAVAACFLIALVGVGAWVISDRPEVALPATEAAAPATNAPKVDVAEPVTPLTPERESVAANPDVKVEAPKAPEATAKDVQRVVASAKVRARFVDSAGQPWDNVWFREASDGQPTTQSGSDGRAELAIDEFFRDREQVFQFLASREGCATSSLRASVVPGENLELGEVVLAREARVRGIVHDEKGVGLAGIDVGLSAVDIGDSNAGRIRRQGNSHFDRTLIARSNARGEFDLRGAPAGKWRLWGKGDERGYGLSEPFEIAVGEEELGVDLEIPAFKDTDSLRGKVVDPTGAGVQAQLSLSYETENESGTSGSSTNPDGTFVIYLQLDVPSDLVASDPQHRFADGALLAIPPGARDLVLRLLDPAAQPKARLRVHGPAGEPVRAIEVESRAGKPNNYSENTVATKELDPGVFEFQVPISAFGLTVTAAGYLPSALVPLDPASVAPETEVALDLAPMLRGHVRAGGRPIADAVVESKRALEPDSFMTFNGFRCVMTPHEQTHTESGKDGAFEIALQSSHAVYLRCTAAGFAPTLVGPIALDAMATPIEIELGPGGAIEGRVRGKDGAAVVGAIVGVTCGDGHPRTMRSGVDGAFRFEGLTTGRWIVLERDEEFRTDYTSTTSSDKKSPISWSCEVRAGATTYHDLLLEH